MRYPSLGLESKVAIVTGGNKGISKGTALCLANAGARVVVAGWMPDELAMVSSEIEAMGTKSLAITMDVTEEPSVNSMVQRTLEGFGRIDILVNNAGISQVLPAEDHTEDIWNSITDTNLKGVFLCSQSVGKVMIKQRNGRILNLSSQAGSVALPDHAAYCASKGGVDILTRVLALE